MLITKKKILLVLFLLLAVNLVALLFVTFKNISASNISILETYPFLKHFAKDSISMSETVYHAEGLVYNVRLDEGELVFDMNVLEPKTNTYIKDISLPIFSEEVSTQMQTNLLNERIHSAKISINMKKENIFSKAYLETWNIERIDFNSEDLGKIEKGILDTLKEAKIDKENADGFEKYSTYFYTENNKIYGTISNVTSEILYRPLLWSYYESDRREDIVKYLTDFYDYRAKSLERNSKDSKVENVTPFSCTIVEKILKNTDIQGENRNDLLSKYCNFDELVEGKNKWNETKLNIGNYNFHSLINSIGYDRIISAKEEEFPLAFDWYVSLLSDIQSAEKLYNKKIDVDREDILGRISSGIINNNTFTLRNICNITEYVGNEEFINRVFNIFESNIENTLKLVDSDIFSSLHCLNGMKDSGFVKSILFKIYRQNFEDRNGVVGLWNKDRYMVEGNSMFLILLKDSYEEI